MLLSDNDTNERPIEAFKTFNREKKSEFGKPITDKIGNISHWPLTDRIGEPDFK